jgi:hypothetical protein
MKDRITLTIDPAVARRAKKLARARQTSVSGLVEEFLRDAPLSGNEASESFVDSWAGRFELIVDPTPNPRRERLLAKHGLNQP